MSDVNSKTLMNLKNQMSSNQWWWKSCEKNLTDQHFPNVKHKAYCDSTTISNNSQMRSH
jgi:hypothetical protein